MNIHLYYNNEYFIHFLSVSKQFIKNYQDMNQMDIVHSKLSFILRRLMFEKEMKPMDLARYTHLPQPTIQRMVKGTTTNPHASTLIPIADFFGISVDQLKGETPIAWLNTDNTHVLSNKMIKIPIINWEEIGKTNHNHEIIWVDNKINSQSYGIVLDDTSMYPIFNQGTLIIVDPLKKPKDRSYVVVTLKNSSKTIFRQLLIEQKHQYLKPLNPDLAKFPIIMLQKEDHIRGVLVQARNDYE